MQKRNQDTGSFQEISLKKVSRTVNSISQIYEIDDTHIENYTLLNITHLFFKYKLSGPNMRSINFDAKTKETCDCDCMINKGTYERFEKDDEAIFDYGALWSFDK